MFSLESVVKERNEQGLPVRVFFIPTIWLSVLYFSLFFSLFFLSCFLFSRLDPPFSERQCRVPH